ncbi:50S ribosomal protein L4 [Pseudofulvimonas gallinarii]|jgi:large subunit ribosomal protein L4|uniref:Large ribosomal subunit protein uL4 n=1 Tax=Pseudofulvimonas gallinarii TaxID=634155 RepID=A0A4R3LG67_9GAMM|nr:50S ribosomal protein L4 [Pseudofulvimonas gallinarii]TCS98540.1 LSU ribosomal protein L4P [Pseudofulvimonas gallinarii]THD13665.1 50S ribosomal protein L4 [Pseudofulvimonas gallinarii]
MELQIQGGDKLAVSETIWGEDFREDLVHQVVVAYRAAGRSGTKAQKTRSEVSGTTKKSKKQKGGGARHGALTAPIFVGGGRAFAAKPRSFEQKVNRKMYRGALRSILSELVRQDRLHVVSDITVAEPRTKLLLEKLGELKADRALIVTEQDDLNLYLAARNIPHVYVTDAGALDPVSLVHAERVFMTVDSVKKIEEWLA